MTTMAILLNMHRHITDLLKALQSFPLFVGLALVLTAPTLAQKVPTPEERPGNIAATVTDPNDDPVPGATVFLQGTESSDHYANGLKWLVKLRTVNDRRTACCRFTYTSFDTRMSSEK